jgi:hypothetical protein
MADELRSSNSMHQVGTRDSSPLTDFPGLESIGIDVIQLRLLAQQGFVSSELRGTRRHFKLRFRQNGRQTTKYIANASLAADVRMELDRLQNATRLRHRLNAARKEARQRLREAKRVLEPLVRSRGFTFHGHTIRQSRQAKVAPSK